MCHSQMRQLPIEENSKPPDNGMGILMEGRDVVPWPVTDSMDYDSEPLDPRGGGVGNLGQIMGAVTQ